MIPRKQNEQIYEKDAPCVKMFALHPLAGFTLNASDVAALCETVNATSIRRAGIHWYTWTSLHACV